MSLEVKMRCGVLLTLLTAIAVSACGPESEPTRVESGDQPTIAHAPTNNWTRVRLPLADAWGVNDQGVIVGYTKNVGAWWFNGTLKQLPVPAQPYSTYMASNVSEDNRMVGMKYLNGKYRALYWKKPTAAPIDLGDLGGGSSQSNDVNSDGVVVGVSRAAPNNEWHAFKWVDGIGMVDIHPKGYLTSAAMRINDKGYIVGFADMATPTYHRDAIRWDPDGSIVILLSTTNTINAGAYGLNRMGDASGQNPSFGPTVWFQGGGTTFYPSALGAKSARSLSDLYRMAGYYIDSTNATKPWTSLKGLEATLPIGATEFGTAADVNTCGWVVGVSTFGTVYSGTLWKSWTCD
ncbi:MAG: hypothetical protein ABI679_00820 [Gemmatimonadota bacterium]